MKKFVCFIILDSSVFEYRHSSYFLKQKTTALLLSVVVPVTVYFIAVNPVHTVSSICEVGSTRNSRSQFKRSFILIWLIPFPVNQLSLKTKRKAFQARPVKDLDILLPTQRMEICERKKRWKGTRNKGKYVWECKKRRVGNENKGCALCLNTEQCQDNRGLKRASKCTLEVAVRYLLFRVDRATELVAAQPTLQIDLKITVFNDADICRSPNLCKTNLPFKQTTRLTSGRYLSR
ncbi:hypothetical protein GJ496_007332 [Pomphorhynchus laevis]|nr:hypothetical protein GJ496_007332 [Pomphorhynchus laevis]